MNNALKSISRIIIAIFILAGSFSAHAENPTSKTTKTVHIIVVLADNANQGIAPVPKKLGSL